MVQFSFKICNGNRSRETIFPLKREFKTSKSMSGIKRKERKEDKRGKEERRKEKKTKPYLGLPVL